MIEFNIDPPSGHAESCLDIQFTVKFDRSDRAEIEIFNDTSGEKLEILSVSKGVIQRETTIVVKKSNSVEGFFNLFNKDKMNFNLAGLTQVNLRCTVKTDFAVEEETFVFYNESQSLDSTIIPFDLILDNNEINLDRNEPIRMHLVCDSESKFELAIKSLDDSQHICHFEIVAKPGRTDFILPSEVFWSDVEYHKYYNKKFQIFWVKFEGITHMKFLNRKYIPIAESNLSFIGKKMTPQPQDRIGPTGSILPADFILSHRYFVPTWRDYTAFGSLAFTNKIASEQNVNRIRFLHEIQSLEMRDNQTVESMSEKSREEVANKRREMAEVMRSKSEVQSDPRQRMLINAYRKAYSKRLPAPRTDKSFVRRTPVRKSPQMQTMSAPAKKGGCGCSRNKNA